MKQIICFLVTLFFLRRFCSKVPPVRPPPVSSPPVGSSSVTPPPGPPPPPLYPGPWHRELEKDVSEDTYYEVKNTSFLKPEYRLNYSSLDGLTRRIEASDTNETRRYWRIKWMIIPPNYERYTAMYQCRSHTLMWRGAVFTMKRYIPYRLMYHDNVEYEVGYLIHNIVKKYQSLLELFSVVHRRWVMKNNTDSLPIKYMLFIYRNMMDMSRQVTHYVNMLHEVEKKYELYRGFLYKPPEETLEEAEKRIKNARGKRGEKTEFFTGDLTANQIAKLMDQRFAIRNRILQKQRKELKKQRTKGTMKKYTPSIEPLRDDKKDVIYGWSIEDWWM